MTSSATRSRPDLHPAAAAAAERGRETKERLLDAAEQLFAARGLEGTSMRAVTHAAGASVSAANYHFGSKEALLRATMVRRLAPINARRLALLDELEAEPGVPSVESVVGAFLQPVFERRASDPEATEQIRRIAGSIHTSPPELLDPIKTEVFGPLLRRFLPALERALPGVAPAEVERGFQFCVGVMIHVATGSLESAPRRDSAPAASSGGPEVLAHMIAFLAAGFRARVGGVR